jgi:hypothetical protein
LDPSAAGLGEAPRHDNGKAVLHETIQYLVERSRTSSSGWRRSHDGQFR